MVDLLQSLEALKPPKVHFTVRKNGGHPKITLTARDVTRFYVLFSALNSGNFLHILGWEKVWRQRRETADFCRPPGKMVQKSIQIDFWCFFWGGGVQHGSLRTFKPDETCTFGVSGFRRSSLAGRLMIHIWCGVHLREEHMQTRSPHDPRTKSANQLFFVRCSVPRR